MRIPCSAAAAAAGALVGTATLCQAHIPGVDVNSIMEIGKGERWGATTEEFELLVMPMGIPEKDWKAYEKMRDREERDRARRRACAVREESRNRLQKEGIGREWDKLVKRWEKVSRQEGMEAADAVTIDGLHRVHQKVARLVLSPDRFQPRETVSGYLQRGERLPPPPLPPREIRFPAPKPVEGE